MDTNTNDRHLPNAYISMAYNYKCIPDVCPMHPIWIPNNLYTTNSDTSYKHVYIQVKQPSRASQ